MSEFSSTDDIVIADIETDAIHEPSVIWMIGVLDYHTDVFTSYVGDDVADGLLRLQKADLIIGHHFRGYDAKQIRRMTNDLIVLDDHKIVDTVEMSRRMFPELVNHKLATWGDLLGAPKIHFKKFGSFTPEMVPYCEQDCRTNKALFDFLMGQLSGS